MKAIRCPSCSERTAKGNYCDECGEPLTKLVVMMQIRDELQELNRQMRKW